jgi:hypothetical protein
VDRLIRNLGAVLVIAGLTWMILVFATLRDVLPGWTAGLGASTMLLGFVLLYRFGFREAERKWSAGGWVPATGTVASNRRGRYETVLVRLTCAEHGTWTTRIQTGLGDDLDRLAAGTPVEAVVRSNDRAVVELVSVGGKPWTT